LLDDEDKPALYSLFLSSSIMKTSFDKNAHDKDDVIRQNAAPILLQMFREDYLDEKMNSLKASATSNESKALELREVAAWMWQILLTKENSALTAVGDESANDDGLSDDEGSSVRPKCGHLFNKESEAEAAFRIRVGIAMIVDSLWTDYPTIQVE
jgi:hypothetical protein